MIHNLLNNIFNKHLSKISDQQLLYYKFKYSDGATTKQNLEKQLYFDNNDRFYETNV